VGATGVPWSGTGRRRPPAANVFLVYGGRYVVVAKAATQALRYALDVGAFTRPPNRGEVEPVTWVRESEGIVYVSNSHLSTPRRQKDGMHT
jgi:hypothetical protein